MYNSQVSGLDMTGAELVRRLSQGWSEGSPLVDEFIRLWRRKTNAAAESIEIQADFAFFSQVLDAVKLRNFNDLHVLVAGGERSHRAELQSWLERGRPVNSQLIVLALSERAFVEADAVFPAVRDFLVLEPDAVLDIIDASDSLESLKAYARRRLSPYRLNPFGIQRVPGSNMFIGRQHEINLLYRADSTSFAVAGPGRIGKTSLVHHFIRHVNRTDPGRMARLIYLDYLKCSNPKDEQEVCRHLTFKINDTRWGYHRTPDKLEGFLHAEKKHRGGQLELILDEVDLVCDTLTFNMLAEVAKGGDLCRLILCGKFNLYEAMHSPKHVFCNRLRMLPLSPLPVAEARTLFLKPLSDLGFLMSHEAQEHIFSTVFADTGGYPHLLQYYGDAIVGLAMQRGQEEIRPDLLKLVMDSDETDQVLGSQLLSMEDPVDQLIAMALIEKECTTISEETLRAVAQGEGIELDEQEAGRLCRKFYIYNVLSRHGDAYQIVNQGLARTARRRGYLSRRLEQLRADLQPKR